MALAVSPWTGNDHEVSLQFADDSFDLFVGGITEDRGEDKIKHLCLNAFCGHGIESHCLGGTANMKGSCLVCTNDHTDDAIEKGTECSLPVLRMCGNVENGHAADYRNGAFDCCFGNKFKTDIHMGMH